jgi:hypothetical protein
MCTGVFYVHFLFVEQTSCQILLTDLYSMCYADTHICTNTIPPLVVEMLFYLKSEPSIKAILQLTTVYNVRFSTKALLVNTT